MRLQVAGLAALAAVLLLAFLLPARDVLINVDGDVTEVSGRASDDVALVERSGIELQPGDEVESTGDDALIVKRATEATIAVDGELMLARSQAETIEELLDEAGVTLSPQDSVLRDGVFVSPSAEVVTPAPLATIFGTTVAPEGGAEVSIAVHRAVPFTLVENGQELELQSSRETLATALRDVGVRLGPGDEVQPPPDSELSAGMRVRVDHASQVVVTLPEGKSVLYTHAETVGEALAEAGIALPSDYRLDPPANARVVDGRAVHVIGVSAEQVLETERIESQTVYQPDPSLAFGEQRVVLGQDGVYYRQYSLVYENGEAVSRELVAEWYDPEPVDTVIYYSLADAPALVAPGAPLDVPEGLNVVGTLSVYATWYNAASAGRPPSDPSYGITATGVPVDRGIIAVDPSVIPLGTRLYVPGYGYGVAADTGGGIVGNMIDLGYPDGVAVDWISSWVDIYILGP